MTWKNYARTAVVTATLGLGLWYGIRGGIDKYTEHMTAPLPLYTERHIRELSIERNYNGVYVKRTRMLDEVVQEEYLLRDPRKGQPTIQPIPSFKGRQQ